MKKKYESGSHELKALRCGRTKPKPGDRLWEIDPGQVLWDSKVPGKMEAPGRLFICKCTRWEWQCIEVGDATYCKQVCTGWDCTELPAGKGKKVK